MHRTVQVRDLRKGNKLWPTGRTVTQAPTRGAKTPRGKSDLGLDGRRVTFGSYTEVSIEDESASVDLSCRDTVGEPPPMKPKRSKLDSIQRAAAERRGERLTKAERAAKRAAKAGL